MFFSYYIIFCNFTYVQYLCGNGLSLVPCKSYCEFFCLLIQNGDVYTAAKLLSEKKTAKSGEDLFDLYFCDLFQYCDVVCSIMNMLMDTGSVIFVHLFVCVEFCSSIPYNRAHTLQ